MDTKDSFLILQEMQENGTLHMDSDSIALQMQMGQLQNLDGKVKFIDRHGNAVEVKVFNSPREVAPNGIVVETGMTGAQNEIMKQLIASGHTVVVIDPKGDNPVYNEKDAIEAIETMSNKMRKVGGGMIIQTTSMDDYRPQTADLNHLRKTNAHLLKKKEPKFYQALNKKRSR